MLPIPKPNIVNRSDSDADGLGNVSDEDLPQQCSKAKIGNSITKKSLSCVSCRKRKLRCDRIKPECGACLKLQHVCEYPQRKRNLDTKCRIRELEAKLAEAESLLASERKNAAIVQASSRTDLGFIRDTPELEMGRNTRHRLRDSTSGELCALNLSEPLLSQTVIDELHKIYFEKVHPSMPMIHKSRYYASLHLPVHMRPPIGLQYAIWTTAAARSEQYSFYEHPLYERARRYIQEAENSKEGFISIYYAQALALLKTFESKNQYHSRAWMSLTRMIRLVYMLGLYKLDVEIPESIIAISKDWIQIEEGRRVFWVAFYIDCWSSFHNGFPTIIHEDHIMTNLPSSEDSFEQGTVESTVSLRKAMTPEGTASISSFGGLILSVAIFNYNFQHVQHARPNEHPEDPINGYFWKRHRTIDNLLSVIPILLPDRLKLSSGLHDMNTVPIHMNIHTSFICLHEAAARAADQYRLSRDLIQQSRTRSLEAAEEIANLMRCISHIDISKINTCVSSCLYCAGRVFIQHAKSYEKGPQSVANLEFVFAALRIIGLRLPIAKFFITQLEQEVDTTGIERPSNFPTDIDENE